MYSSKLGEPCSRPYKRLRQVDSLVLEIVRIVLECVYSDISKKITKLIKIPTIGIGASINCDGQVLVTDDILGLTNAKIKFVKKYINIRKIINSAVFKFKKEVKSRKYPTKKYSY